ncbi:MAG TPA: hypothetical protein ENJ65_01060 [Candidatus Tenderia electrophaga]|uniref:Uncharacterized protein n=1 Tax=Candidatus Tenderia electrophaga TaxID=1748243 RepID=A0A832J883_9GAMM|nr:hypothetical protein [Candidatus Tenderia electrophaga]
MLFRLITIFMASIAISQASIATENSIQLSPQQVQIIGQKIWQNEGRGKIENLTVWNKGEAFPSFGIGHFIWYPPNTDSPFTESFPQLKAHLQKTITLPDWLNKTHHAPWPSREIFYRNINNDKLNSLRQLLHNSIPQQVEFIVQRMEAALPKLLKVLPTAAQRKHVRQQFYRVAQQPNGIYALIDYVNFKGEGIASRERYKGQGWGLLQVLENMHNNKEVMPEFVRAADFVLSQRVKNAPRDESRWLPGWRNRIQTYLHH